MVSTPDFDSGNLGSNPGKTSLQLFDHFFAYRLFADLLANLLILLLGTILYNLQSCFFLMEAALQTDEINQHRKWQGWKYVR
jgi:hypothetical protein